MRAASFMLPCLVVTIVLQACARSTIASGQQCPGGRNKITPTLPPQPSICPPPPAVPTLTTELGIFLPVVLGSGSGGAGVSLAGIAVGRWGIVNAAFSAAVVYTKDGLPTIAHGVPRAPEPSQTLVNRNTAVLFAVFGVARYLSPAATTATTLASTITGLGLDVNVNCPATLADLPPIPACVGLKSAEKMIETIKASDYNYEGCIKRQYNCQKFLDWVGFEPKNTAYRLTHPHRWQPLVTSDASGTYSIQTHIPAHVGRVKPFVLTEEEVKKRKVSFKEPTWRQYVKQAKVVLDASASLSNDTNKLIAEFFDVGIFAPIGFYVQAKSFDLMKALSFYHMFSMYHDLFIIIIAEKTRHNTVRPQSAIRYVFGSKKVLAYAGRGKGTQKICGNEWAPYIANAPEAEYPSGQTCFCQFFSEWLEKFLGTKNLDYTQTVKKGCALNEPGITPQQDTSFHISTTADFVKLCKKGRILGGMHFPYATDGGAKLCKGLGYIGYDWIKKYWPALS